MPGAKKAKPLDQQRIMPWPSLLFFAAKQDDLFILIG
jgi:hypothetical protein